MIVCNSDFLQHHGVLGMKWGVRRYQRKDGSLTPAGRKHLGQLQEKQKKTQAEISKLEGHDTREQYAKDRDVLKKNPKKMSNEELEAAINRIKQEQRYSELIKPLKEERENQLLKKGKEKAVDILVTEGESFAKKKLEELLGLKTVDYDVLAKKLKYEKSKYDFEKTKANDRKPPESPINSHRDDWSNMYDWSDDELDRNYSRMKKEQEMAEYYRKKNNYKTISYNG